MFSNKLLKGAFIALIVAGVGPIFTVLLYKYIDEDIAKVGPVGDWLAGSTVPFLTLGAFLVAYATFKSQKKELELSRLEFKKQNEMLDKQRFENTFFIMLKELQRFHDTNRVREELGPDLKYDAYVESISSLKVKCVISEDKLEKEYNRLRQSDNASNTIFYVYKYRFHEYLDGILNMRDELDSNGINKLYRYVDKIFELIRRSNLTSAEAIFYADFLRIYISSEALISLFYYSLSGLRDPESCFNEFSKYKLFDLIHGNADICIDSSDYKFFNFLSKLSDEDKSKIDPSINWENITNQKERV
ncbi:hypothetical protein [Cohnella herbarum]|uniref:Phage abortive infection protein n=1 Tax=Cohnella herbarum TaxID=2728023 RepID=A0A7Z2ZL69_9BACL|nr:hypothetical protein [Cohnella herbarum]QJD83539.1 hypothetical protein HH215_10345 [Cohnella herbarum]